MFPVFTCCKLLVMFVKSSENRVIRSSVPIIMPVILYVYVISCCILVVPYLIIVFQFEPTLHDPTLFLSRFIH